MSQFAAVFTDAGDVNVGREAARPRGRADADRVLSGRAAGVAGDAAGDDAGYGGQMGGNLQEPRLAGNAARHNLHNVAKAAGLERFPQWVAWHVILRSLCE